LEENAVDIFKLNNRGFTLIEIAITIAVVGIIGVAFSGFFINSARIIDAVDEREKAVMITQQEMEELKARGYIALKDQYIETDEEYIDDDYKTVSSDEGFPEYNISLKIEKLETGLFRIELTNSWNNNQEVKLVTYIAER